MKGKKNSNDGPDFPASEPSSLKKLRLLVSALSMAEKNAFKRYIRSYSDHNRDASYIRLYDCINDCLTEDERKSKKTGQSQLPGKDENIFYQKFKSRNARRKVCKPSELGHKSNYLFDRLLESQRSMNFEQSERRKLYVAMLDVQFLFSKEMWKECLAETQEALKIAKGLEALPQLLELLNYERRLLAQLMQDDMEKKLRNLHEPEQKYLNQLRLVTFFHDLRTEIFLLNWKKGSLEDNDILRTNINSFLEFAHGNKPFDDTFDLNFLYHSIMAGLVRLDIQQPSRFLEFLNHQKYETTTKHYKAIIDQYKRYPERKKESFTRYLGDLSNYLSHAYSLDGKVVSLEDFQDDLEKIKPNDPNFLAFTVYFTLLDCIKGRDFLRADNFLIEKQVRERIENLGKRISSSRLQVIRQLAGTVLFVREKFKEADVWFKANLDDERNIKNMEAMAASELYHLLMKFELGGTASLKPKKVYLEPLLRRLGDSTASDSFEGILLRVLEDILKAGKDSDKLRLACTTYLPALKEKLEKKNDPSHFHLFIGWMESKSTGKGLRVSVEPYL